MTPKQFEALDQAIRDGGEIVMAGIDQTEPRPRRDVVNRLQSLGYITESACMQTGYSIGLNDYFRVTQDGHRAHHAYKVERGI